MNMRWRGIALASFSVNVLLAAEWWSFAHRAERRRPLDTPAASAFAAEPGTNVVVRRQFFSWQAGAFKHDR